jgi:hypothetical protein
MRSSLYLFLLLFITYQAEAQFKVPRVNGWRVHLPYHTNQTLAQDGNIIYAGSASGVFSFDTEANEAEVLSKADQLSDVEVQRLEFDQATQTLIIAYRNTNIDLISKGVTYNISSVLRQSILGEKLINDIYVDNGFAYLACSFGIVKIDLSKRQIVDSYQNIGPNGANLNVLDVAVYNGNIYASSPVGLFRASVNSVNLSDFNFWNNLMTDTASQLLVYENNLLVASPGKLLRYNGITFDPLGGVSGLPVRNLRVSLGKALCIQGNQVTRYDNTFTPDVFQVGALNDALSDANGYYYMAIDAQGIVHTVPNNFGYIWPLGPWGRTAYKFAYSARNKQLFVAGGSADGVGSTGGWRSSYNNNRYYVYDGTQWHNAVDLNNAMVNSCQDFLDVVCDDAARKTYLTSFGAGVLEVTDRTPTQLYDSSNTGGALGIFVNEFPTYRPVFAAGGALDENGNLWVTCYGAANPLAVKTRGGQWYSMRFNGGNSGVGYVVCDNNAPRNNKWIINTRTGNLYVYNEGADLASDHDDLFAELSTEEGKGKLSNKYVLSMALDKRGEMWIGTAEGLCVISDPTAVFSTQRNRSYDAHQLVFNTGSFNSVFLGTDAILCIKVDGANRKWIGTRNGVWLVSEDGYTVIRNFTTENSPLLSNTVYDIGIFEETGEVFFATEKGIVSYAGDATQAGSKHGNVLVYPNPVKPGYTGDIAIRGLVENANVKITDMAGNLVYETKANGGMATWNGITFAGKRAATGVYLIYSTGEEDVNGERDTYVTKLLFVN